MKEYIDFVASDTFAWLLVLILIGGSLAMAYMDNVIPLVGIVVIVIGLSVLAIIAAAFATGDTEAFFRALFK